MTNRDNRRAGELPEFTREQAVEILRNTYTGNITPTSIRAGDLVQSKRHFAPWGGCRIVDRAPLIVLVYYPDLGAATDQRADRGVAGFKLAKIHAYDEGIEIFFEQAWNFEPYDGPMPGAH